MLEGGHNSSLTVSAQYGRREGYVNKSAIPPGQTQLFGQGPNHK